MSTSNPVSSKDLPPPRKDKAMRSVSPPLSNTRLSNLIYYLIISTTLLAAYFSYRMFQYKTDVGGWWNLALGRPNPAQQHAGVKSRHGQWSSNDAGEIHYDDSVEKRINELAEALGIPSKDLASAIAVAVREYVPPASLSSLAAEETGEVVQEMLGGTDTLVNDKEPVKPTPAGGVVEGVLEGLEAVVGFDEP